MTKLRCGTTLRAYGKAFDARSFVKRHAITTEHVWNCGEPPVSELPPLEHGGFTLRVSDAIDAAKQMDDAAKFLRRHHPILVAAKACRQVEELWLEVAFPMRSDNGVTSFAVPRSVIDLTAELDIQFVISALPRDMARLRN